VLFKPALSDYVAKPVDLEQLFSVLRVLIFRLVAKERRSASFQVPAPVSLPRQYDRLGTGSRTIAHGIVFRRRRPADRRRRPIFAQILGGHGPQPRAEDSGRGNKGKPRIALAREFNPAAITLDTLSTGHGRLEPARSLQARSDDAAIPVHIISGDEDRRRGLALGAMTYIQKASDEGKLSSTFGLISKAAAARTKKVLLIGAAIGRIGEP